MMQLCTGRLGADWVLGLQQVVDGETADRFAGMVARRQSGEPLQYIVGMWGFRSLDLEVGPGALIPRPETEMVVEFALGELSGRPRRAVAVDLGTGTGAIALSLAVEGASLCSEVWATDLSESALCLARLNAESVRSHIPVHFALGEWFEALPAMLRAGVDLVVSNPPYISEIEYQMLDPVVRDHEPRGALVSGPTGLEAIRKIVAEAPGWLSPGGCLVVEIAPHQADTVRAMALRAGFTRVEIRPDLTGRDRCLVAGT